MRLPELPPAATEPRRSHADVRREDKCAQRCGPLLRIPAQTTAQGRPARARGSLSPEGGDALDLVDHMRGMMKAMELDQHEGCRDDDVLELAHSFLRQAALFRSDLIPSKNCTRALTSGRSCGALIRRQRSSAMARS